MNSNIKKIIFNNPATIVYWEDGTKTVVKCGDGDTWDKEKGLAMCFTKKALGNKGNFNEKIKKYLKDDVYENTCTGRTIGMDELFSILIDVFGIPEEDIDSIIIEEFEA